MSWLSKAFGGLTGGPATNSTLPTAPTWAQDLPALQATEASQQALTNQDLAQSQQLATQNQDQLKSVLDTYRQNAYTDLTTGQEGEQMRQYYNNLGLLNSGAFNQNLGNQFAQIQQNSDLQLMQAGLKEGDTLQGILGQGYQNQTDLQNAGLQRQYGLEDQAYQGALNSVLARRQDEAKNKQSILGGLGQGLGMGGSAILSKIL